MYQKFHPVDQPDNCFIPKNVLLNECLNKISPEQETPTFFLFSARGWNPPLFMDMFIKCGCFYTPFIFKKD